MDIETIQKICLSFTAATEDVKWGDNLCFSVGGKMFCITNLNPPHTFSFKVNDEMFEELIEVDGFGPAPYLAKSKWVIVTDPSRINSRDLESYLLQSYNLIKSKIPKTQRAKLGLE